MNMSDDRLRTRVHVAAKLFTLAMHVVMKRMKPTLIQIQEHGPLMEGEEEEVDEWWREEEVIAHASSGALAEEDKSNEAIFNKTATDSSKSESCSPNLDTGPKRPTDATTINPSLNQGRFIWGLSSEDVMHAIFHPETFAAAGGDRLDTGLDTFAVDIIHPTTGLLPSIYHALGLHDSKKHYSLILGVLPLTDATSDEEKGKDNVNPFKALRESAAVNDEDRGKDNSSLQQSMMLVALLDSPQERLMTLQSLLTAAMSVRGAYDSRSRSSITLVAQWLDISLPRLWQLERTAWVISMNQDNTSQQTAESVAKEAMVSAAGSSQNRRMRSALAVGGIAVGAGALLAVTGGLAAPFIAAGLGTLAGAITGSAVSGAAVATGAASAAGTGVISASLGVLGATSVGTKAHKQLHSEIQGDFGYVDLSAYEQEMRDRASGGGKEDPIAHALLQLPLNGKSEDGAASVTICVNGWIAAPPGDFFTPWIRNCDRDRPTKDPSPTDPSLVDPSLPLPPSHAPPSHGIKDRSGCPNAFDNRFALLWEEELLSKLGSAMINLVKSQVINQASTHILSTMAVGALLSALALPLGVLAAMRLALGDCWHLALRRSKEAGYRLAHHLIAIADSPSYKRHAVTLIGFSIGARVVFHALLELERQGRHGLVENAILIGSPVSCDAIKWVQARSVVSSRLVNCYSDRDWVLGVMFKIRSAEGLLGSGVAGLGPVLGVDGVENIGLSRMNGNQGHEGYTTEGRMEEIVMDAVRLEC